MRFKKIEWEYLTNRPAFKYVSSLPFGYEARIWETFNLDAHRWSIARGAIITRSGTTTTIEEAKTACQTAWEKMVMKAFEEPVVKSLSWNEQEGNIVAYGVDDTGFIIERGRTDYIVQVAPSQQFTKHHFGFATIEEAKAWCEQYNRDSVEEALEWIS